MLILTDFDISALWSNLLLHLFMILLPLNKIRRRFRLHIRTAIIFMLRFYNINISLFKVQVKYINEVKFTKNHKCLNKQNLINRRLKTVEKSLRINLDFSRVCSHHKNTYYTNVYFLLLIFYDTHGNKKLRFSSFLHLFLVSRVVSYAEAVAGNIFSLRGCGYCYS